MQIKACIRGFLCVIATVLVFEASAEEVLNETYLSRNFGQFRYSFNYSTKYELNELNPRMVGVIFARRPMVSVSVSIQDIREWGEKSMTLDAYIETYDANTPGLMSAYDLSERQKTSFAGNEAYLTVYTSIDKKEPPIPMKSMIYTFMVDDIFAYNVGYIAAEELYNEFLPEAVEVMDSFELQSLSDKVWTTYTDIEHNFSINYTLNWHTTVPPAIKRNFITNHRGETLVLNIEHSIIPPARRSTENITVMIKDRYLNGSGNTPMSLAEYREWDHMISSWTLPDYVKLESAETFIDNEKAYFTVYSHSDLKSKAYVSIIAGRVYILTYTAKTNTYDKYLSKAEQIIKSFKLDKANSRLAK